MRVFTPEDIYIIDKYSESQGISVVALMGNAGKALAEAATRASQNKDAKILIVAGGGNNGGDGYAAACALKEQGYNNVSVLKCSDNLTQASRHYYEKAIYLKIDITDKSDIIKDCGILIDALIGIGLKGPLKAETARIINKINSSGAYIISADIPSGLGGYNGLIMGEAVKADKVVCFAGVKTGMLLNDGKDCYKDFVVADIGAILPNSGLSEIYTADEIKLPPRKQNSHKGNYSNVKIIGGSQNMCGAPFLAFSAAKAALRVGAGLVTLGVGKAIACAYQSRVVEEMLYLFDSDEEGNIIFNADKADEFLKKADAVVIGMGHKPSDGLKELINYILSDKELTVILDAGALDLLDLALLKRTKCKIILTPHTGEFSRLSGFSIEQIQSDGLNLATDFCREYNCILNLKGASSIITDGKKVYINHIGTPAQAKGGSGDVLAGATAAFCKRLEPLEAAAYAARVCGKAAVTAAKTLGEDSVLASDVIASLNKFTV